MSNWFPLLPEEGDDLSMFDDIDIDVDREGPDALSLVSDIDRELASAAATRYERVNVFRVEQSVEADGMPGVIQDIVSRAIRLELAAGLRITEYAAEALLYRADALVNRYPAVLAALRAGRVTDKHAQTFVDLMDTLEPDDRPGILDDALRLAEAEPTGTFGRSLRKLVDTAGARTLQQRHTEAVRSRGTSVEAGVDGMGALVLTHPMVEIHAIHDRVTRIAKVLAAQPGETRTLNQIRADVMADLLIDGTTTAHPERAHGIRATVAVTVPVLSLLDDPAEPAPDEPVLDEPDELDAAADGPDDATGEPGGVPADGGEAERIDGPTDTDVSNIDKTDFDEPNSDLPDIDETDAGESNSDEPETTDGAPTRPTRKVSQGRADPPTVEGVGPIPLDVARALCAGAKSWMRILTHPETGMVLSVGRKKYRPPPSLRKLVQWRADRCMAPGCAMPASRCQIDHSVAFSEGGETALTNLAPLCTGHHTVKHHGGWSIVQSEDGSIEWTSPTGRHYTVHPERRVPVFTPAEPEGIPPF